MILFVFEGTSPDTNVFRAMNNLFLPSVGENVIEIYGNNIYRLCAEVNSLGGKEEADIVSILQNLHKNHENNPLEGMRSSDFSEVYLFFDYDFHDNQTMGDLEKLNRQVEEMLTIFDNETENGKLYIHYPMVEAVRYTKQLPDQQFIHYFITRDESRRFKNLVHDFSSYPNIAFLTKTDKIETTDNWKNLILQNLEKANYYCNNQTGLPTSFISQPAIFTFQEEHYQQRQTIAVLSAFPFFLFEYLGVTYMTKLIER